MKRLVAILLLASPAWIASGVAGWWFGGGHFRSEPATTEVAPKPASIPSQPVRPAPVRAEVRATKLIAPAPSSARQSAPQVAMTAPAPQPKMIVSAPASVVAPPEPIASLGSTDVSAPEQALAPASAETAVSTKEGVLIVVSLASQKAFVFKDGELWGSTAVSTGRKGKRTPVGRYTILEKQVHHRSRTYDNAPMPYMQRLTWGGVALHAGHVTGRPASHGCIRLPRSFAKRLYNLTDFGSTTVVVTNKKARSSDEARGAA